MENMYLTKKKHKYQISPLTKKYFKQWLACPTPFGSGSDLDCFYRFVKACIRYSRGSRKDGQWFRKILEKEASLKFSDKEISKAISLFEHLIDFHYVDFPRPLVEMREPFIVKSSLEKHYPADEVDRIMHRNFGPNWENENRKKMGLFPKKK